MFLKFPICFPRGFPRAPHHIPYHLSTIVTNRSAKG
jgi:hypothetical protein